MLCCSLPHTFSAWDRSSLLLRERSFNTELSLVLFNNGISANWGMNSMHNSSKLLLTKELPEPEAQFEVLEEAEEARFELLEAKVRLV